MTQGKYHIFFFLLQIGIWPCYASIIYQKIQYSNCCHITKYTIDVCGSSIKLSFSHRVGPYQTVIKTYIINKSKSVSLILRRITKEVLPKLCCLFDISPPKQYDVFCYIIRSYIYPTIFETFTLRV